MSLELAIAFTFLSALQIPAAAARLVNVTIDDTYGDERTGAIPQYLPSSATWLAYQGTHSCPSCTHFPNSDQAHENTWHANTVDKDGRSAMISLSFSGTAIRVFFFLVNEREVLPQSTHVLFTLDNGPSTAFDYQPHNNAQGYLYDVPVYVNTDISDSGPHTLLIQQAGSSTQPSIVFFDYAMYEMDDLQQPNDLGSSTTAPTSPQNTARPTGFSSHTLSPGAAAGIGVVSTIVLVALVAILFLLVRRWLRRKQASSAANPMLMMSDGSNSGPGVQWNAQATYASAAPQPASSSLQDSTVFTAQPDEAATQSPPPYQVGSLPRVRKGILA